MADFDDPLYFLTRPAHEASEIIRLMNSAEREVVMAAIKSRLDQAEKAIEGVIDDQAMLEAGQMEIRIRVLGLAVPVWSESDGISLDEVVSGVEHYIAHGELTETVGSLR